VTALLFVLSYIIVGVTGFGGALFVVESPYLKPLLSYIEKRREQAENEKVKSVLAMLVKGMGCMTCSGFWASLLCGFVFLVPLTVYLQSTLTIWAWLLSCALFGSGVSTAGSYLMNLYFDWRKLKGL
jgi:hypothetical protein